MFTLTQEQKIVADFKGYQLIVNAYAGSGKTTVLKAYANNNPSKKLLYLAYNRAIKDEATQVFPTNVTCNTSHQLAYHATGYKYRHKLKNNLSLTDIANEVGNSDWELFGCILKSLNKFMHSADHQISEHHLAGNVAQHNKPTLMLHCQLIWADMVNPKSKCPMTHDGYLKIYQLSKPSLKRFDGILFDEAQDVNPVTRDFILNQSLPWIMVGDQHQQIYRFRGAENAMGIKTLENVPRTYLTQSFRFGKNIADIANTLLRLKGDNHSISGSNKIIGSVFSDPKEFDKSKHHTVLHRTVMGVIETALNHKKCFWIGGIGSYRLDDIEDLFWFSKGMKSKVKTKRNIKVYRNFDHYREIAKATEDSEMRQAIRIIDKHKNLPDELKTLREMEVKTENKSRITVGTAHRSKGLEWKKVKLHDDFPDLLEEDKRRGGKEVIDELNLMYVSVTRAIEDIIICPNILQLTLSGHKQETLKTSIYNV
jgi:superfamily I DNA/RNA helicase